MSPEKENVGKALPTASEAYEAPQVETVLTADELEREVLYAGNGSPVLS